MFRYILDYTDLLRCILLDVAVQPTINSTASTLTACLNSFVSGLVQGTLDMYVLMLDWVGEGGLTPTYVISKQRYQLRNAH